MRYDKSSGCANRYEFKVRSRFKSLDKDGQLWRELRLYKWIEKANWEASQVFHWKYFRPPHGRHTGGWWRRWDGSDRNIQEKNTKATKQTKHGRQVNNVIKPIKVGTRWAGRVSKIYDEMSVQLSAPVVSIVEVRPAGGRGARAVSWVDVWWGGLVGMPWYMIHGNTW